MMRESKFPSPLAEPIPAVVMLRGTLCCIVIDLLSISTPQFIWDADSSTLLCGLREVKFPTPKSVDDFRKSLALGSDQVAVVEVGAAGQPVREHKIIEPSRSAS